MKLTRSVTIVSVFCFTLIQQAGAEVSEGKNFLSFETAGRGGLYSFDYDRELGRTTNMGIGFSYVTAAVEAEPFTSVNLTLLTIPVYGMVYLNENSHHRFFGSSGITIVYAKAQAALAADLPAEATDIVQKFFSDLHLTANAEVIVPMPVTGAGYEFRSSGGTLIRGALYAIYIGRVQPWFGISAGSSF